MFSTLRNRFGIPGVISVIALVFAMFGGAYAASNSSGGGKATVSAKAKAGPRGKTGKTGPAGPAGPAGSAGAKGDAGAAGAAGTPGTSVTSTPLSIGNGTCPEGGAEFKVGASTPTHACNGEEGSNGADGKTVLSDIGPPSTGTGTSGDFYIDTAANQIYGPKVGVNWGSGTSLVGPAGPTETVLPAGKTETGVWAFRSNGSTFVSISYPLSYPISLTLTEASPEMHYVSEAEQGTPSAIAEGCPGSGFAPTAASETLCVYEGVEGAPAGKLTNAIPPESPSFGSSSGDVLKFTPVNPEEEAKGGGTWAVTR
jgi:hypothetical protein